MALFKEGEVVILQSKSAPHLNGEYTVKQIVQNGTEIHDRIRNITYTWIDLSTTTPGYILEECIAEFVFKDSTVAECAWAESALRKKSPPSDMSYKELMSSLKNSVLEWQ